NRREWSEETEDTNVAVRLSSRRAGCLASTGRCRSAPASEAGGSHTKCISCVSQRLLVIVIEFAQSSTNRIKRGDGRLRLSGRGRAECASERLDVSLCAQAGDPAFLYTLCFFLKQFLLDVVPRFGERTRSAAMFIFDFDNIIIAGVIDDVADSADWHVECEFFELGSQSVAL